MDISCFVSFGLLDETLARLVAEKLKVNEPFPTDGIGFITVNQGVVSVIRNLYDIDPWGNYAVFSQFDEREEGQRNADEQRALSVGNVARSLMGFFDDGFPDEQAMRLIKAAVVEGGVVCRVTAESDLVPADFSWCAAELREKREKGIPPQSVTDQNVRHILELFEVREGVKIPYEGKIFVLTGFDDETEADLVRRITSRGGVVKSSVVLATDFLVVNFDYFDRHGSVTAKCRRAVELMARGQGIMILSERHLSDEPAGTPCDTPFRIEDGVFVAYTDYSEETEEIVIPNGVTRIGDDALMDGEFLRVVLPKSLVEIGETSFANCFSLERVTISEGLKAIGSRAFERCESLSSLKIPASVSSIGAGAFGGCLSLTNITVHPDNAFYAVKNSSLYSKDGMLLVQYLAADCRDEVVLPAALQEIGDYAFVGRSLTGVVLPTGLTRIGAWSFWSSSLKKGLLLPDSVTEIGDHAFLCCSGLKAVTIPAGVETIGEEAFAYCRDLGRVVILNPDMKIGKNAFAFCRAIEFSVPTNASLALLDALRPYDGTIRNIK